jgi:hypothetical protein
LLNQWLLVYGTVGRHLGIQAAVTAWAFLINALVACVLLFFVVAPLSIIYVALNYLDLRIRKEHYDLELRAAQLVTNL